LRKRGGHKPAGTKSRSLPLQWKNRMRKERESTKKDLGKKNTGRQERPLKITRRPGPINRFVGKSDGRKKKDFTPRYFSRMFGGRLNRPKKEKWGGPSQNFQKKGATRGMPSTRDRKKIFPLGETVLTKKGRLNSESPPVARKSPRRPEEN